jgi:hypothetical protein
VVQLRLRDARTGNPASIGSIVGRLVILGVPGLSTVTLFASVYAGLTDEAVLSVPPFGSLVAVVILVVAAASRVWTNRTAPNCSNATLVV